MNRDIEYVSIYACINVCMPERLRTQDPGSLRFSVKLPVYAEGQKHTRSRLQRNTNTKKAKNTFLKLSELSD